MIGDRWRGLVQAALALTMVAAAPFDPDAGREPIFVDEEIAIRWGGTCGGGHQFNDVYVFFSEPGPDGPDPSREIGAPEYFAAVMQHVQPFMTERCGPAATVRLRNFPEDWAAFTLGGATYLVDRAGFDVTARDRLLEDLYGGFLPFIAPDPWGGALEVGYGDARADIAVNAAGEPTIGFREGQTVPAASREAFRARMAGAGTYAIVDEARALLGAMDALDYAALGAAFADARTPTEIDSLLGLEPLERALHSNAGFGLTAIRDALYAKLNATNVQVVGRDAYLAVRNQRDACVQLMNGFSRAAFTEAGRDRNGLLVESTQIMLTKRRLLEEGAAAGAIAAVDAQAATLFRLLEEADWRPAAAEFLSRCRP